MIPVLLLDRPIELDYYKFVSECISSLNGASGIDILIGTPVENSEELNFLLGKYYQIARSAASKIGLDYRFEINILFNVKDTRQLISRWSVLYIVEDEKIRFQKGSLKVIPIPLEAPEEKKLEYQKEHKHEKAFEVVAVGGTFDHIHDGHKILLSMTYFLAKTKIIIGITGSGLLTKKMYPSMLESFPERQAKTIEFLRLIMSSSKIFEIYEINDVCGPTGWVSNIQALVVSQESSKGGEFINSYRKDHNLPVLAHITVEVIGGGTDKENFEGKLSSTTIRKKEYQLLHL